MIHRIDERYKKIKNTFFVILSHGNGAITNFFADNWWKKLEKAFEFG